MTNTKHFINERIYRETILNNIGGGGKVVLTNVIDRGHKDGAERFELTEKGVIFVYNNSTNRRITILFARVGQLYSRFGDRFRHLPQGLQAAIKAQCREWERLGYNNL